MAGVAAETFRRPPGGRNGVAAETSAPEKLPMYSMLAVASGGAVANAVTKPYGCAVK
jgi:hypothetical protein